MVGNCRYQEMVCFSTTQLQLAASVLFVVNYCAELSLAPCPERKKKSLLNTNISLENRSRVNRRELNAIPLFGFQLWDYVLCELGCELIKCSVKVELS